MPIFQHEQLAIHEVPRIKTRVLVDQRHAKQTTVWEQRLHAEGHIPLHYHEVEEVLIILAGEIELALGDQTSIVRAPATVIAPARQLHGLRPSSEEEVHLLAIFPTASPKIYAPDGSERPMPWEDVEG